MKQLFTMLFVFCAISLNAQSFMGISIGGTQENVKSKLVSKGFKLIDASQSGYLYKGKLNNEIISIMVMATPKTKIVYSFFIFYENVFNSWNSLISEFNNKNEIIVNKYGYPLKEIREYEFPYEEGDSYSLTALETEKLNFYNAWNNVGENNNLSILLKISKYKNIQLLYSNIYNNNIANKEKAELNNDDY